MAKSSEKGPSRVRQWALVVYPESAPSGWRDILDDLHIEWVESPLHDRDINPATGEIKKAHWHILLLFDGPKSFEQVAEISEALHAPIPQRCHSARGAIRYMAHLDNPEKAEYDKSDIIGHGGVDVAELLKPTSSQRYELIAEMMQWIAANDIIEMEDLLLYAASERRDDWFPLLCDSCAYIIGALLKSRRHRADREARAIEHAVLAVHRGGGRDGGGGGNAS